MATFEMNGLEDLAKSLAEIAEIPEVIQDDILNTQADIAVSAQKERARTYGVIDTGLMVSSIKKTRPKRLKGGVRAIYVYPQGSRSRGKGQGKKTNNSEIAFVNEYGVRGRVPRPFIRDANAACEDQIVQAAADIHDKWLKTKNL